LNLSLASRQIEPPMEERGTALDLGVCQTTESLNSTSISQELQGTEEQVKWHLGMPFVSSKLQMWDTVDKPHVSSAN
jgi:hypothetical protein